MATKQLKNDSTVITNNIGNKFNEDPEKIAKGYRLPSDITDRKYLFYPPEFEEDEKDKNETGKWMLFAFGDLEKIDFRWMILQRLVLDGLLIALKSSTAIDKEKGITICYTADAQEDVKKAAEEIRKLVDYEYPMYYKTHESSMQGQYRHEGSINICKYMHTYKGGFYERDQHGRWKCLHLKTDM